MSRENDGYLALHNHAINENILLCSSVRPACIDDIKSAIDVYLNAYTSIKHIQPYTDAIPSYSRLNRIVSIPLVDSILHI